MLHIIFVSTTCSRPDYEKICRKRKYPLLDSSQKFFEMFLNGLSQQQGIKIDCITVPPISRGTYPGSFIPAYETSEQGIHYYYTPIWNFPVIKSWRAKLSVKKQLKKIIKDKSPDNIHILCDPLLLEGLMSVIKIGKRYGIKTTGFLTDMPDYADECDSHKGIKSLLYRVYNQLTKAEIRKLDNYIVLTEAMSNVAGEKPWLLLDCIVDQTMLNGVLPLSYTDTLPHVIYAGKLHKEFGLDLLGEAIQRVRETCIFDIYGDGNYIEALKKISERNSNIRVHGIVPMKEVLSAELSATILINPRTSQGEFTKYSFPSKTAEYMLASVPVVMFRLPGISVQYDPYLCYAEEETAESLAREIDRVLKMSVKERKEIGVKAYRFITEEKHNGKQASRVVKFLYQISEHEKQNN